MTRQTLQTRPPYVNPTCRIRRKITRKGDNTPRPRVTPCHPRAGLAHARTGPPRPARDGPSVPLEDSRSHDQRTRLTRHERGRRRAPACMAGVRAALPSSAPGPASLRITTKRGPIRPPRDCLFVCGGSGLDLRQAVLSAGSSVSLMISPSMVAASGFWSGSFSSPRTNLKVTVLAPSPKRWSASGP